MIKRGGILVAVALGALSVGCAGGQRPPNDETTARWTEEDDRATGGEEPAEEDAFGIEDLSGGSPSGPDTEPQSR